MSHNPIDAPAYAEGGEVVAAAIAQRLKAELEPVVADQLPDLLLEALAALAEAERSVPEKGAAKSQAA